MREHATLVLVLSITGCAEHGSTRDDLPGDPLETPRFQPVFCTGGLPSEPTCPVNQIDLAHLGFPGSFEFVMQPLGSGVYLTEIRLGAGPQGLILDDFTLRVWTTDDAATDLPFDETIGVPPNESLLLGTRALVTSDPARPLSLAASSARPF